MIIIGVKTCFNLMNTNFILFLIKIPDDIIMRLNKTIDDFWTTGETFSLKLINQAFKILTIIWE